MEANLELESSEGDHTQSLNL